MKLLIISAYNEDASAFYRIAPLHLIQNKHIKVDFKDMRGQIDWSTFTGYTHLFLERPSSQNDLHIIKLAKQCGLKVIVDLDDDILHLDVLHPLYGAYEEAKAVCMECIVSADEVWVSTKGLKKSLNLYNKNIHVIPNAHNDYLFPVDKKKPFNPETKKAIFRGGASHEADVYEKAEDLVKIINGNKDWFFEILGFRFIYLEQRCGDNYLPVSPMPLMQYFEYMYKENPNVVFHPLCDTVFNRSKSNIAWIEASYVGAAFFGNKNLPEFNLKTIVGIEQLPQYLSQNEWYDFEIENKMSWDYIKSNLLLSNINKLREERLLA